MKFSAVVVLLGAVVALAEGFCYRKELKLGIKTVTHCQDNVDETWHAAHDTWINSQCFKCNCNECCSVAARPVNIPEDCVAELDSKACVYNVYKKNDPSIPCPVYAYVGK